MNENYVTTEELREAYLGDWVDAWDKAAPRLIETASARLRARFAESGHNLADDLDAGRIEMVLVKDAVLSAILRVLSSSATPLMGEFSQFSQTAGSYSVGISPLSSSGGSLYYKRDELKALGLGGWGSVAIDIVKGAGDSRPRPIFGDFS